MTETVISIAIILSFIWLSGRRFHRYFLLNKYKTVLELLDYFSAKAFDLIYTDQIVGYTSEGHKVIPKDEWETIERNFIKMTFEIMGTTNEEMFIMFFGDKKTVIDNLLLYARQQMNKNALVEFFRNQEMQST
jgi:hypothetical protein